MRHVLRFWSAVHFITVFAACANYRVLLPHMEVTQGVPHVLLAAMFAVSYSVLSIGCCHWLWRITQKAYLNIHGRKLRGIEILEIKHLAPSWGLVTLTIILNVGAVFSPLYNQLLFWLGIAILTLNIFSLLFLAGYVAITYLGYRFGKISYVVPCGHCETVCNYNEKTGITWMETTWATPEE